MNEHGYLEEVPLPTYEEVVGASNHNTLYKNNALLRPGPSHADRECMGVPEGDGGSAPLRCFTRWKHWAKKYLAALLGVIITPLFFLFIILQLKSCASCTHLKENYQNSLSRIDKCNLEMTDIARRYNLLHTDLQSAKKQRDDLLRNKETIKTEMENLRFKYNYVSSDVKTLREQAKKYEKQIEDYKRLLKNQNNDNAASPITTTKRSIETTAETSTKSFEDFNVIDNMDQFDNEFSIANLHKIMDYIKKQIQNSANN